LSLHQAAVEGDQNQKWAAGPHKSKTTQRSKCQVRKASKALTTVQRGKRKKYPSCQFGNWELPVATSPPHHQLVKLAKLAVLGPREGNKKSIPCYVVYVLSNIENWHPIDNPFPDVTLVSKLWLSGAAGALKHRGFRGRSSVRTRVGAMFGYPIGGWSRSA